MEESKIYTLTKAIDRPVNGVFEPVLVVEMVAPSKKMLKRKTYRLQQYVTRAMISSTELLKKLSDPDSAANEGEAPELDASTVMGLLLASDVDIDACIEEFGKLAQAGAVMVDDLALNASQWLALHDDDKEGLLAEYLANFILPLVMQTFSKS